MRTCYHNTHSLLEVSIPEDKGYVTHYKCKICGSTFPVIGDTDEWESKLIGEFQWHYGMLSNSGNMLADLTVSEVLDILDDIKRDNEETVCL
jgi:hypothetical protein